MCGEVAARKTLSLLDSQPQIYFTTTQDPLALGLSLTLPDGPQRARIPGLQRWIWDAADAGPAGFAGSIGLRRMTGHAPLPPQVLGNIGYAVVPWQRRRGHATRAPGLVLDLAREQGLTQIEITTDTDNLPSQRVITAPDGMLLERFNKGAAYGAQPWLRYRIDLAPG